MSERPSSGWPRSCSGDMNSSVPSVWPTAVSAGAGRPDRSATILAMPKSSTLTKSSPSRALDHHVLGLHVPVDDAQGVRLAQRLGHLVQDRQHALGVQGALLRCTSCRRRPAQQLHRQVQDAVLGLVEVVGDDRVRVAQLRAGLGLAPEAGHHGGVRDVVRVQELERHLAAGGGVQLPAGMKAGIPYDATEYIENAINEVLKTLTETLLIVIVVIFLFLGSLRAVLIPVVAIPISLIGAVFLMLAAGFTINLLTLLAIVLSVGLVVDDAIVMVENVERHLHDGKPPLAAALEAARELVGPIIAMTITLAAVYAPVGIQGGLTGALFREFAFTLAGAVHRLRRGGADAVADDGREAAARGRHRARVRRLDQSPVRHACAAPTAACCRHAAVSAGGPRAVGDRRRC